jgi:hypothetical protein
LSIGLPATQPVSDGVRGGRGELGGEAVEELVGHGLGRAVDQPRAELGHLAADLRLHAVAEDGGVRPDVLERHIGAALGEAHRAALALARDGVGGGRIDVGQRHLAAELGRHRAELQRNAGLEAVIAGPLHAFAAGNGGLQHGGVVQRFPDALARGGNMPLAGHLHGSRSSCGRA